ncbi:MAG: Signal recognition particle protein [Alphaproteobacteria bacterium MarineAlpha5_Bin5]|nr:MAG: Signal recognition particle protein [Alphaproteobacteria bacterium MarineAlpha5_Bin5]PPR52517.1 MAG: Signal recognition particle protein [Alphaproteobacteria bacterium MarineAlpha5_Bin4]|tara:strand:+ start:2118 stop:3482 length:1365 start_codon:yes stop_codon:yes gene_type:complete
MFDTLNDKFEKIVRSIRGKAVISESDLDATMREIRIALLEADVALIVVKEFIDKVKEKILGQEVLKSVKADQMIIKLVQDELITILGSENQPLNIKSSVLTKILLCGLQGSGKTTTIAKLAKHLLNNSKKKILLVSTDIYRPAAQEQLKILADQVKVDFFTHDLKSPIKIVNESLQYSSQNLYDIVLLDTAGRQVVEKELMAELVEIEKSFQPNETLLVADALTGQDAANVAKSFSEAVKITGSILTRIDGDSRGGAALSIKTITGAPIKFIGLGEKLENFEIFYPDRIAQRILGMGDIVSLVEKASENVDQEEMESLAKKIAKGNFDLDDFAKQLKQMGKMGGVSGIMSMLPGISKAQKMMAENKISDSLINHQVAIINSMTKKERSNPNLIKASRKIRISKGSGTRVQDVNKLLKQFLQSQKMMKRMKSMGKGGLPNDLLQKMQGNFPQKFN